MNLLQLKLTNPITQVVVDDLIATLKEKHSYTHLLLDFGNHDFQSFVVLKYCKIQLESIQSDLLIFTKIAFVTIPPYKTESPNLSKLQSFFSRENALEWLQWES